VSRVGNFRLELGILGFFLICWLAFFATAVGGHPLAGRLIISLYQLYGLAALVGWLLGNTFVQRSRKWVRASRRRLLLVFLLSPGGLFYLLWALGPVSSRLAAPFAPLYAFAVSAILFLVPVSFRRSFPSS